ncbi:HAD family hydrolase [Aeromicrobium sp. CTD01-1L150]|uniref:HAD family hydrolase n=1 Tax=Aeromicrobium sp. CTD01-1L150 TaxID=3341830 RepID=UPI0035BFE5C1
MTTPGAVLWDLDGTIVDTEPLWMAQEAELAAEHGVEWTQQDGLALVGNALITSAEYIRERIGSDLRPEQIVERLVGRLADSLRGTIPWRPGARELIEALDEAGVPQALVTMSYAEIAEPVAQALPFGAVVTGDSVTHGKPHPEPYLRAAQMLGVDPARCLAIEDSATGAASAEAAGCLVLAVPHMVDIPLTPRRVARDGLGGVDVQALRSLWADHA